MLNSMQIDWSGRLISETAFSFPFLKGYASLCFFPPKRVDKPKKDCWTGGAFYLWWKQKKWSLLFYNVKLIMWIWIDILAKIVRSVGQYYEETLSGFSIKTQERGLELRNKLVYGKYNRQF